MKYLSLFSGIGGFELGIQKAYENNRKLLQEKKTESVRDLSDITLGQDRLTCVGYSEINKYAIEIYQKHFPNHKNYGDITKIDTRTLENFDLLVGGFPCQSFSVAGKRGGFSDTRGTLFFEIARIAKAKKPRFLLLENVKGLLSHDESRTFFTIISTLDELGYDLQWQVLNSKNFGVPQNRERVLIVGHLRGTPRPEVFPIFRETTTTDKALFIDESQWRREGKLREYQGISPTLNTCGGGGHLPLTANIQNGKKVVCEDYHEYKKGGNAPTSILNESSSLSSPTILQRPRGNNKGGFHEISPTVSSNSWQENNHLVSKTIRSGGRASPHGSKQNWDSYEVGGIIRRLTPMECERLQGFPDGWTEGISDAQRYKCCGNAVTTNVIQAVMERIFICE